MTDFLLRKKLQELCSANATLLWLEGPRYELVNSVKVSGNRLILNMVNNTSRVVAFERYAPTEVGLQFWASNGRPGVLYKWDRVPNQVSTPNIGNIIPPNDEPPTPPYIAA